MEITSPALPPHPHPPPPPHPILRRRRRRGDDDETRRGAMVERWSRSQQGAAFGGPSGTGAQLSHRPPVVSRYKTIFTSLNSSGVESHLLTAKI